MPSLCACEWRVWSYLHVRAGKQGGRASLLPANLRVEIIELTPRSSGCVGGLAGFRRRSLRVPNLLWTDEPQRASLSPYSFSSPLISMFPFGLSKEHYPCLEGYLVFSRMSVVNVFPFHCRPALR